MHKERGDHPAHSALFPPGLGERVAVSVDPCVSTSLGQRRGEGKGSSTVKVALPPTVTWKDPNDGSLWGKKIHFNKAK